MKKFMTMPVKASPKIIVALAALTLLTGAAKSTPAPTQANKDADYKAYDCQQIVKDKAEEKRNGLIRGML